MHTLHNTSADRHQRLCSTSHTRRELNTTVSVTRLRKHLVFGHNRHLRSCVNERRKDENGHEMWWVLGATRG